jgi:acylphosphatase
MKVRVHLLVQGVVQGVGFRYFVLHHAQQLGVEGYVKNLFSEDVEIEAQGERGMVETLIHEVSIGPRFAHITSVDVQWLKPDDSFFGFEVQE